MRTFSKLLVPAMIIGLGASPAAFGSGFSIFEQGAKATGMGGAFAATADDPSAMFYNVAGLAQQRRMTVLAGGTLINFDNEFEGSPDDPLTSGTRGNFEDHTFIPPNAYVSIPFEDNITFGIGVMAPYGLRTDWEDPWVGRFVSKDANLKVASIQPSVAWQTDDGGIAVGLGMEYRRSRVTLSRNTGAFSPFSGRIVDTTNVYLSSGWEHGIGWTAGVLFKSPDNAWRFGASYRSRMTIDYDGRATFTQIPTGNTSLDAIVKAGMPPNQDISTSVNFPALMILGLATSAVPNWDIEFDVTQTTWERFKSLDVAFSQTPSINLHRPQNWHNTYSYRLGGNRRLSDKWSLRMGGVFDENPQPNEAVGPLLPDADRYAVMIGIGFHHGPWIVDVTEMALHFKDRNTHGVSSDDFNGIYKTDANLISINVGYRF